MGAIYQDRLIKITEQEMVLHRYYFPLGSDKHLPLSRIASVSARSGGSSRLWGTRDIRTWFPQDNDRPRRDRIFIVSLLDSFWRIGFTVEDSQKVADIFKARGLLHEPVV